MKRDWTHDDVELLRRLLAERMPWPAIAAHALRSESACRQAALHYRLYTPRRHRRHGPKLHDQILRYHALGLTDTEIGAALDIHRKVVGSHRRWLGLSSNHWSARQRRKGNRGWFRKGSRHGRAARLYGHIGQTRIRRRPGRANWAQVWIKLRDDGPTHLRWIPFARHVWQRLHGPVPPGMIVVHANGDTLDDDPANLRIISRRELPAWQSSVRPLMEARRRAAASRAARQRWRVFRARRDTDRAARPGDERMRA